MKLHPAQFTMVNRATGQTLQQPKRVAQQAIHTVRSCAPFQISRAAARAAGAPIEVVVK